MGLVGIKQNRIPGGKQIALIVDADFQHPLSHHQVFLDTRTMTLGLILAQRAQAQLVKFRLSRNVVGKQGATDKSAAGADQALALTGRQYRHAFKGPMLKKGGHRYLQALGDFAQHFDRRHAAAGFDLREHRPAYTAQSGQGIEGQKALAAQALKILCDPLAVGIFILWVQVIQIQYRFIGAHQEARGLMRVHA